MFGYNGKTAGLANEEMYRHQLGELAFRSWVKGLTDIFSQLTNYRLIYFEFELLRRKVLDLRFQISNLQGFYLPCKQMN